MAMARISMMLQIFLLFTVSIKQFEGIHKDDEFYEVTAFNSHERFLLYSLHLINHSITFLNDVTNEAAIPIQTVVDRCCIEIFEKKLQDEGIEFKKAGKLSGISKHLRVTEKSLLDGTFHEVMSQGFVKWDILNAWIDQKSKNYSNIKKNVIANTYENRELFVISVNNRPKNPAVIIVGGEEGRDWMSSTIIINFIDNLLENQDAMFNYYNFHFLPILNPDGYVYSMEKEIFWTKNRKVFFPKIACPSKENGSEDYFATGVNIERNWYFEKSLGFTDTMECNSIYLGHKPLSEEEPKALAEFIDVHAPHLMAFLSIKGFGGRLITIPYADNTQQANNHGVLMDIIMAACEKVYKKHNSTYHQGTTARYFYNVSGNSADWVKKNFNIPIVATIHLGYKDDIFVHESHRTTLTEELTTIVKEVLMISKDIYGPLFNNQIKKGIEFEVLVLPLLLNL